MLLKNIELRRLLSDLKTFHPHIYGTMFRRIYADDHRFNDWRLPLWIMGNTLSKVKEKTSKPTLSAHESFAYQQISQAGEYDFPLFFVEPELFKACASSGLPKGLKLADLKMPFPAFTFILPQGALPTKEGEVPFITVSGDLIGKKIIDLGGRRNLVCETTDDAIILSTFFPRTAGDFTVRITDTLFNSDVLPAFHEHCVDETGDASKQLFGGDARELDDVTLKISALVPALIMAMECRPDIYTAQRRIKQLRRDRNTEIWEPNRLGAHYRIKLDGAGEAGTHSSPRAHVRRGHFRLQPIGHGKRCICHCEAKAHDGFCMTPGCECKQYKFHYTETKKMWIEPMLVNFKTEAKQAA